jgi:hypothetical protein
MQDRILISLLAVMVIAIVLLCLPTHRNDSEKKYRDNEVRRLDNDGREYMNDDRKLPFKIAWGAILLCIPTLWTDMWRSLPPLPVFSIFFIFFISLIRSAKRGHENLEDRYTFMGLLEGICWFILMAITLFIYVIAGIMLLAMTCKLQS